MNATLEGLQDLVPPATIARVGKYLPPVATVALVALIAWQLAKLTWLLLPRPAEPVLIAASTQTAAASQQRAPNAQKIADAHLFGVANAVEPAEAVTKVTNMTLVLSGTIATGDPTKGFAFIGESANAAKFIKVGDAVGGGAARLHSVYPEKVILDRGGQLESLMLPRQGSGILGARAAPAVAATQSPTRFAENLRRIAETNPSAFTEIVRPQPFINQGVMQGFRVYPGRNRQQFAKLGLQPGDVVKAVNGTPLDDPQRSGEIFSTISATDRVQLTIERNGQIQQLNINTAQVSLPETTPELTQGTPPQETRPRDAGSPETQ